MEGIESGLSASVVYVVPPILFISCLALALPARISTGLCVVIMVSWLAGVFGWWAQKPWSYSGEFPWWGFQRHFFSVLPVPLATALGFALALRNIRGRDRPHAAALHLAFDAGLIHHVADVGNGRVADHVDDAGLGIDLHLRDVAAVREGRAEAALGDAVHRIRRTSGEPLSEIEEADRLAPGLEFPVPIFDGVRSHRRRGVRTCGRYQPGPEELHRAPRAVERARAARAAAHDGQVQVALVNADALGQARVGHAQALAENAHERGLVALASGLRHATHVQDARRVEARVRLVLGCDTRGARLEESRDANSAQLPFARRALAPGRKAAPAGEQQCL